MDRNREARRASMATSNGLSRRRHRSSSLRDSPEEDGAVELPETARLRDRGSKKDRDRERDRDRDRSSRSKRRRGDRLMHGSNREDGGEESTEESVNDEEEEDEDDAGAVRMLPPNPTSLSSAMSNHQHRKSYPPAKVVRAPPVWKAADEMIGVSVPRKARSASTKRSHECWASGVGGVAGDQIHRQASTSPVRPNLAASTAAVAASPASISPSSSNVSIRKKMKPNGPKLRPPKSSSKASSSIQEDIEIEVAEALAVMRQSQGPSKQEIMANDSLKFDSREVNKSANEAKSRVSSPISNSASSAQQSSSMLPQNSNSSAPPLSAVAPKRKRPRPRHEDENPAIFGVRNSPISSTAKVEIDQPAKIESPSPNLEKNPGSANENGGVSCDLMNSQSVPASSEPQPESLKLGDSKPLIEEAESRDVGVTKEEPSSPRKESPLPKLDDDRQDATGTKANSTISNVENQREEKFQIDLMAPPPQMRSSPERDGEINFIAADPKLMVSDMDTEMKPMVKEGEKVVKIGKDEAMNAEPEEKKAKSVVDEAEPHKSIVNKERIIDLQLDLEKHDRDTGNGSVGSGKLNQHAPKQQQPRALKEEQNTEKTAQSAGSVPLPMSVASWPGGLPPMGYMAPLQGVVSMDGGTVSSAAIQPPHFLFSQPRPKRCATHYHIAWNICQHQHFTRMNPFWPAAAGTPSLYGAKACNLNVLPSVDLHGNFPGRNANPLQDKGQGLAIFSGHSGKDKGSQGANPVDAAQRKQILLQQALPPGAPSSILHGPFIFPLGQQQAVVAAASARPGSVKSPPPTSSAASSSASNSAPVSASTTAAATTPFPGTATALSFNYPNLPANDTQYLAILQNNGYPFPIPAHVGTPPAYRGTHAQAVPFFNGPFYSSQMLHPSQLPQQQQQQPTQQPQQIQHGYQNTSISSGSSSSQKHLQNLPQQQQQRPHGSGVSGGSGSLQNFPAPKNRPAQPPVMQQPQQLQHAHVQLPHQARQLEAEVGSEDSPSTADSRVSRGSQNVYGQNFAMPLHPSNFALVAPPVSLGSASGTSANHGEKKQQQPPQQHGLKAGVEPLPSQAFAVSFASINGAATAPGLDISSMAQNHAILQSLPETARHGYHIIATAQAAQQKKNYRPTEEGKSSIGDSSSMEEERKVLAGKAAATVGQSIAFSRPDLPDTSVATIPGNGVIDNSARSLNLSSAPARASASVSPATVSTTNAPNSQQRQQQQQQQQQQIIQLQKQHQFATVAAAAARSKTPATSNGSVYSDHLPSSSSMAAKFPNALSAFPQNFVQGSSSPGQSPQWKNSVRTSTSQVPTLALSSSTASSLKNLPQQQVRSQQSHIQISFAANPKSSAAPQGQQPPNSNQSPSPPMVVGSPTSLSKSSTGGSPRTTPSTGNKTGQASSLSSQQSKNSPSVPSRKSSPVGGRNVPSILGNPHITSSNNGPKAPIQQQQQQQQQQLSKQPLQQTQLFFSSPYLQAQGPHSTTSTSSASSGYYLQRRRSEQQPQQQQPQGSSGTSSTGMLTLCPPVTLASASTSDPARAIAAAAAASNMKGGGLPSQGIIHAAQFAAAQSSGNPHSLMPASFPYVHAVPTAVQVKPAEQKQPAGNDNLRALWQPEKK